MYVPKDHPDGGFDIKTRVSNKDISYLLATAFECGYVNYWCVVVGFDKPKSPTVWMERADDGELRDPKEKPHCLYDWPLSEGGAILIAELDDWEECGRDPGKVKTYRIDRATIQKGLLAMQEKSPRHMADFLSENSDADTGDVFLQYCCGFPEGVRYG